MNEGLPRFVLDARVLANYSVCDIFLRLAEEPPLYSPKWTDEILTEAFRTLEHKLRWPPALVAYFEGQLRATFSEAGVRQY